MNKPFETGPFRLGGRTTIYALYDKPVEVQGTIYRLDTHTARHPKQDILGATKCLYVKCRHFKGLEGVTESLAPVKRSLFGKIRFWWLTRTEYRPFFKFDKIVERCELPSKAIFHVFGSRPTVSDPANIVRGFVVWLWSRPLQVAVGFGVQGSVNVNRIWKAAKRLQLSVS